MKLRLEGNDFLIRQVMTRRKEKVEMQIKELKEQQKGLLDSDGQSISIYETFQKIDNQIAELEGSKQMYFVSRIIPARFENIVINFSILDKFIKKLKGFNIHFETNDNCLVVQYSNESVNGQVELLDISKYYKLDIDMYPKVVIEA